MNLTPGPSSVENEAIGANIFQWGIILKISLMWKIVVFKIILHCFCSYIVQRGGRQVACNVSATRCILLDRPILKIFTPCVPSTCSMWCRHHCSRNSPSQYISIALKQHKRFGCPHVFFSIFFSINCWGNRQIKHHCSALLALCEKNRGFPSLVREILVYPRTAMISYLLFTNMLWIKTTEAQQNAHCIQFNTDYFDYFHTEQKLNDFAIASAYHIWLNIYRYRPLWFQIQDVHGLQLVIRGKAFYLRRL